jgi:hypothetical protein
MVPSIKSSRLKRLFAMLCLVLALVYAGGSASQVVNTIQHSGAEASAHDHSVLSDALAMQADHHADIDPAESADDQAQNEIAGGHHHHGDNGPSLLATSAHELPGVIMLANLRARAGDRHVDGIAVLGPERPPMVVKLAA